MPPSDALSLDLSSHDFERRLHDLVAAHGRQRENQGCVQCTGCVACLSCTFCRDSERLVRCNYCVSCRGSTDSSHCRGSTGLLQCQHCNECESCSSSSYLVLNSAQSTV